MRYLGARDVGVGMGMEASGLHQPLTIASRLVFPLVCR